MRTRLLPAIVLRDVCELTPAWLKTHHIRVLLCDLDNTLAGYKDITPDDHVAAWLSSMKAAGVTVMIVSNSPAARVAPFADPLGIPFVSKSRKPRPHGIRDALEQLGAKPHETLFVGDQIFTDVFAASRADVRSVLVNPRTKGFWYAVRRGYERPFFLFRRPKPIHRYTAKGRIPKRLRVKR